jgi:hypothetical protein
MKSICGNQRQWKYTIKGERDESGILKELNGQRFFWMNVRSKVLDENR